VIVEGGLERAQLLSDHGDGAVDQLQAIKLGGHRP
jgi:hypothetical protein